MIYKLVFTPKARNQLKNFKKLYQKAAACAIEDLIENPFLGKKLSRELKLRYSYRVGAYRIIYKIDQESHVVYIISIGHRSHVYQ